MAVYASTPSLELLCLHRGDMPVFWYKSNPSKLPISTYVFGAIWGAVPLNIVLCLSCNSSCSWYLMSIK